MLNFAKKVGIYSLIYLYVLSIQSISFANAESISQNALPTNGIVKSGSASISQTSNTMNVNQSSNNAIISWNKFNIGSKATVNFNQPSSSSNTLNRVRSSDPSRIYGNLNANGNIFFINPNGVLVGKSGSINVGGLVASTMNMANNDFNKQNYNFSSSSKSSIINYGNVNSKYVALLSSDVKNYGSISATSGTAALVSGDNAKLSLSSNGKLNIKVSESKLANLIENEGTIKSENGQVLIKSSAAKSLVDATIKGPSGKKKLVSVNGVLKLVSNTGEIKANSVKIDAGQNGMVSNSGSIDVSSKNFNGGNIEVTGKEISIKSGSKLLASGKTGGGDVLIGGDWKGSGDLLQSTYTTVEKNTLIDASSTSSGDGGKIVIWSDIKNSKSKTSVNGTLLAHAVDGDGGEIETSGSNVDTTGIKVNAGSKKGKGGLWLIDPYDYIIGNTQAASISTVLNSGTNVTILTSGNNSSYGSQGDADGNGDITVNSSISSSGTATLTLTAARDLTISSGAKILDSGTGALSVALNSARNMTISGTVNVEGSVALKTTTYQTSVNSTTSLSYTGAVQNYTVPSGISSITVSGYGAAGGSSKKTNGTVMAGGKGGFLKATVNVTAGETLKVYVGGVGTNGTGMPGASNVDSRAPGGFNGGGKGGYDTSGQTRNGAGGGGATDIRSGGTELSDRIFVAGGGGGAGGGGWTNVTWLGGDGGGTTGAEGGCVGTSYCDGGNGGTQSAGGAANTTFNATSGALGVGGNASYGNFWGDGGGGGGYYGGGGGSSTVVHGRGYAAGGGGGSSWTSGTIVTNTRGHSSATGNGSLTIVASGTSTTAGDLTIGSGGITAGGGLTVSTDGDLSIDSNITASTLSVDGNIDLNSSTLNNSGSSNVTLSGVISGAGNLTHSGSGTLTLSGTNTYTGDTRITDGTLSVSGSLASGTDVIVGKNGTYNVAKADTVNSISGAGNIKLAKNLTAGSSASTIFSGIISGSGAFAKAGTGTLILTGANTFTGSLNIAAGTITIGGTGSLGANNSNSYSGTIAISANSYLNYTSTTTPQSLTGSILLGIPMLASGTAGAITAGTAKHSISSAGGKTTITYTVPVKTPPKAEKVAPKIRKQIKKEVRKETRKLKKQLRKEVRQAKKGNNQGNLIANVGGNLSLTPKAMAKFSSIKVRANSAGIKANFKPLGGTKMASIKPANFKVNNSGLSIKPFKAVNFSKGGINFKIPEKNIEVPQADTKVSFGLKLKSGADLPGWVKFDSNTLQISGTPPEGFSGSLELDLVATAEDGTQKTQDIKFNIN